MVADDHSVCRRGLYHLLRELDDQVEVLEANRFDEAERIAADLPAKVAAVPMEGAHLTVTVGAHTMCPSAEGSLFELVDGASSAINASRGRA